MADTKMTRMRWGLIGTTLALLVVTPMSGNDLPGRVPSECANWPAKPSWEWTTEERMQHRFDRTCLTARRAQAAKHSPTYGSCTSGTEGDGGDFVFGTDTPELYMPYELFNHLIMSAFTGDPGYMKSSRGRYDSGAIKAGMPQDWYETIERVTHKYLQGSETRRELALRVDRAGPVESRQLRDQIQAINVSQCAERAALLETLRQTFPAKSFDRFLYTTIAHGLCSGGREGKPEGVQYIANGCRGELR
jgi:hypothetical protein